MQRDSVLPSRCRRRLRGMQFIPLVLLWAAACSNGSSGSSPRQPPGLAEAGSDAKTAPPAEGGASATMTGAPCTADGDCGRGVCAASLGLGPTSIPAPGGYCTAVCKMSSDCTQGSACNDAAFGFPGYCAAGCESAGDCRAGYRCVALARGDADAGNAITATCEPTPKTDKLADGVVGSACNVDGDCAGGRCGLSEPITSTPFPGGYCTGDCLEDADCGARGYCVPGFLGAAVGSCSLRCSNDADCGRDDYRCRTASGVSYCVPGPKPLPDGLVGNPCGSDADCGGGAMTCGATVGGVPAPLGYCSESCSIDPDCGAGGMCINGIMSVLSTGICYKSCVPPAGCRDGYACESLSGSPTDPQGVCAPIRPSDDAGAPDAGD